MRGGSLPWRAWFVTAVREFGLTPEAFWALSAPEWRWLLGERAAAAPLDQSGLGALMQQFPDTEL